MQFVSTFVKERLAPITRLKPLDLVSVVLVGILGGIMPFPMLTTPATVLVGHLGGLSKTEVLLSSTINLLCTPLQLMMMPVWGRGLANVLGQDTSHFTITYLQGALANGVGPFVTAYWDVLLYGMISWIFVAIVASGIVRGLKSITHRERMRQ